MKVALLLVPAVAAFAPSKPGKQTHIHDDSGHQPRSPSHFCDSIVPLDPYTVAFSRSSALNANIVETLKTLQGPGVCWGSEGVELGHEENDIKGYDNFDKLVGAVAAAGLAQALSGPGPFTVFAPVNSAFDQVPAGAATGEQDSCCYFVSQIISVTADY